MSEEKLNVGAQVVDPVPEPPEELKAILDKMQAGQELTPVEENTVLALELVNTRKQLAAAMQTLNEIGMHLCAVVQFYHNGAAKLDKLQYENFFKQYDARANIGYENVTGDRVVSVLVRPRKGKKNSLILPSAQERKEVERTKQ